MAKKQPQTTAAVSAMSLAALVGFGANGTYAAQGEVQALVDAGHAEIGQVNENGQVPVRATQAGYEAAESDKPVGAPDAPVVEQIKAKRQFKIDADVPMPANTARGGRRGSSYPFDALEINHSFFVADGDTESGDAARSMASTVAAQNARYSEVVPGEMRVNRKGNTVPATKPTRKFVARRVTENGEKGVRIFRVSL